MNSESIPKKVAHEVGKDFIAVLGEFIGTVLFLWLTFAGVSFANHSIESGDPSNLTKVMFIAFVVGLSALINMWIFLDVSGGLFNPAITFALMLTGKVGFFRGLMLIGTEFAAGIVAASMVRAMFPKSLRAHVSLQSDTTVTQGLFIEAMLTAQIALIVLFIKSDKQTAKRLTPPAIGLALFANTLVGYYYTGASMNPAAALGPHVIRRTFPHYLWIYFVGPFIGTILGVVIYGILRFLQHELEETKGELEKDRRSGTYAEEAKEPLKSGLDLKF